MIAFDTKIIVYALNQAMPQHRKAHAFLAGLATDDRVVVAEQTLVEVYLLIRNPAIFPHSYSAADAVAVCQSYRANPKWKLVDHVRDPTV